MNLESEVDEPKTKRLKSENDYGKKSCKKEEDNMQENAVKDIADGREISLQEQEHDELVDSNKETLTIIDSDKEISAIVDSDDESFTFPPDENVSDMLDEVQYSGSFPTVTDRYFTPYYKMDAQSLGNDTCIWIHSNRICMLSLAPSHIILQDNKDIQKVNFKVSDKLDRSLNKVSGKSKHGAQPLQTNSNICTILCKDGQTYVIKCYIVGKLVEVNEALSENPQLLKKLPHKGGYLAIILPNIKFLENFKQSVSTLTHDKYIKHIKEKENKQQ
ncbi:PREDICTED: protein Simiate [Acromyrmex echinatior]|uniref:protein Simiate n=1 Tax=Acromyrmex echinatior TaxID=103372 RepID=UPI000580F20E|nr:PREDICTED: protein Simiate [Acromyrmex echinatior]XP_011056529.1 PREDICTED: protein Simiate [Acromyrmex echinatior]